MFNAIPHYCTTYDCAILYRILHYTISYHTALMNNIYVILELELELFSMILIPQDFRTLYHHLISSPTYLHSFLTFLYAILLISISFLNFSIRNPPSDMVLLALPRKVRNPTEKKSKKF